MEAKPLICVQSSKPVSVKKVVASIDKFLLKNTAKDEASLVLTNRERSQGCISADLHAKLTVILPKLAEFAVLDEKTASASAPAAAGGGGGVGDGEAFSSESKKSKKRKSSTPAVTTPAAGVSVAAITSGPDSLSPAPALKKKTKSPKVNA